MAPTRPAKSGLMISGLMAIAPSVRRAAISICGGVLIAASFIAAPVRADPVAAGNVPLPTPAPQPKTGTAPPATASAKPAETPSLFPFSLLFGHKSSSSTTNATSAPSAPEPPSPFDAKQRALLDRVSAYLSSAQTMVGKFVQVGPDGGRTEGTFYLQKPGRVRFQYNPPSPIDIISDGSSVVVRDRKLATQDLYPLSQTPLRYLLADRIDLLRDTDVVSVTSDDSFATVVIEQKQLFVGTDRLMIMFDAKDLTLKQWTVTDPQGFDTTVAVYNLDSTKKPDPNLFVINYQRDQGGIQ
jgi:outer membrane lipoprotein-sorting protein